MNEVGRVITAMITPFNENGRVDYEEAAVLADALINCPREYFGSALFKKAKKLKWVHTGTAGVDVSK